MKIGPQSPKTEFGAQNQYDRVSMRPIHWSEILYRWRKYMLLGVEKAKIGLQSPKKELCSDIYMVVWYVYRLGILYEARKNTLSGVNKTKISLQGTNMQIGAQNQYGRVIYPSIGNCIWIKIKHSFSPFTGDFDLPKQISLNGLFLFFFDKVRHFLTKFSTLVTSQKKVFFALSEASKSVFCTFWSIEKCFRKNVVLQVFLSNLNNHLFLKFWKKNRFWISKS
jgi:hypothetical protein